MLYSFRVDVCWRHDVIAVVAVSMIDDREGVQMDGIILLGSGIIQRGGCRSVIERLPK